MRHRTACLQHKARLCRLRGRQGAEPISVFDGMIWVEQLWGEMKGVEDHHMVGIAGSDKICVVQWEKVCDSGKVTGLSIFLGNGHKDQ